MSVFSENLRKRVALLGLSGAEAARKVGVTERSFAFYLSGRNEPKLPLLAKIARTFGTTPNELLGFGDDQKPSKRSELIDRLTTAAHSIAMSELEVLAIQAEALTRRKKAKH